jgi:hypothetical protein
MIVAAASFQVNIVEERPDAPPRLIYSVHAGQLLGGDTKEDILENARISLLNLSKGWLEQYKQMYPRANATRGNSMNLHFSDDTRYADTVESL